jgi:hypothetical protein
MFLRILIKKLTVLVLCFFMNSILIGMNHNAKYHTNGFHYALAGESSVFRGQYITKTRYPLFIKQKGSDDILQDYYCFDSPIESMNWHLEGKYTLHVVLDNGEKYRIPLKCLQSNYLRKKQVDC